MQQNANKQAHVCNGHVWVTTSSPLIERCGRAGCRAMRQWRNGAWSEPETGKQKPARSEAQQPGLWA